LRDTRDGIIIPGSIEVTKIIDADTDEIDWTFTWKSNRVLENVEVRFDPDPPGRNNSSDCFCNTSGSEIVLDTTNATVYPENLVGLWEYEYRVEWGGWCCESSCDYGVEVSGEFEGIPLEAGPILTAVKICSRKFPGI